MQIFQCLTTARRGPQAGTVVFFLISILLAACGGGSSPNAGIVQPEGAVREVAESIPIAGSATDPVTWTPCAVEGQTCAFTGTRQVRFGADTRYVSGEYTTSVSCSNAVFGDPAVGTFKQCSYSSATAASASTWQACASEGGTCAFGGTQQVRYGADTRYVSGQFTGQVVCSNAVFGDPAVGTFKGCSYMVSGDAQPSWVACAYEGQACSFSGVHAVRYGTATQFVTATFTGGTACNNAVFGDPAFGSYKSCSYATAQSVPLTPVFWGVALSAALSYWPDAWVADITAAGITTVRAFDATTSADHLKPITDSGMTATGILSWTSPNAPGRLPIDDLAGWRDYVTAMITRYKGRVQYWEVWNEPPNFTTDGSPASYGAVVAAAYDAAKAVDPTVQIGLAAKANHVNFLAQSIEAGAADKFDFITLHPYENAGLIVRGWEGQFMSIRPRVRTMLLDKNPAKADVPVWFTEIGLQTATDTTTGVSAEEQADGLVKIYTMAAAQGVERVYWFSPRDAEGVTLGLEAADGTKRPAYTALKTISAALGTRPNYVGWVQPNGAYYGFVFDGPTGAILVAWTPPAQTTRSSFSSAVTAIDPRSGASVATTDATLNSSPRVFVAASGSVQAMAWMAAATANVGKAFAWYGDHGSSSTVTLSASSGPDGVSMMNAPAPTVAGGVAEFDLEGSSGATFVVDPAFLAYTTRPIKITATLRSHGTGTPGFNLKYESNAPLASTDGNGLVPSIDGWHAVSSTTLYEKSWIINDPRFVGFYGYNFTFDTDGPTHSQFSIQKVTVTKM